MDGKVYRVHSAICLKGFSGRARNVGASDAAVVVGGGAGVDSDAIVFGASVAIDRVNCWLARNPLNMCFAGTAARFDAMLRALPLVVQCLDEVGEVVEVEDY